VRFREGGVYIIHGLRGTTQGLLLASELYALGEHPAAVAKA
jgi:hypothetical protein